MAQNIRVVNLEDGMPTVEAARKKLNDEINKAKAAGTRVLKIIHGYGSTGQGGKIRPAVHHSLAIRQREKSIRCYVKGEDWEVFNVTARNILDQCPETGRDSDLGRANPGITIVMI